MQDWSAGVKLNFKAIVFSKNFEIKMAENSPPKRIKFKTESKSVSQETSTSQRVIRFYDTIGL